MPHNAPTAKYNQSGFSDDLVVTILLSYAKEFDMKFTLGVNHYNQIMTQCLIEVHTGSRSFI